MAKNTGHIIGIKIEGQAIYLTASSTKKKR
jgi:hypothetical protein